MWCCKREDKIVYFTVVDPSYPDRLSYSMLKELKCIWLDFINNKNYELLKNNGQKLLKKFNDPVSFDQLTRTKLGIEEVKVEMRQNITNIIEG